MVGDDGAVWTDEHAWVMCLWATRAWTGPGRAAGPAVDAPLARGAAFPRPGLRRCSTDALPMRRR